MQAVHSPLVQLEICVGMWSCKDMTLSHHGADKQQHNQSRLKIKIKGKGNKHFVFTAGISDNQMIPVHPTLTTIPLQLHNLYQAPHFSCSSIPCVCQDCAPPHLLPGAVVIPLHILRHSTALTSALWLIPILKKRVLGGRTCEMASASSSVTETDNSTQPTANRITTGHSFIPDDPKFKNKMKCLSPLESLCSPFSPPHNQLKCELCQEPDFTCI